MQPMSETIVCTTCGGSGKQAMEDIPVDYIECPDCIRGRQPSREVLERMAKALVEQDTDEKWLPYFRDKALAAWLAEHKEEQT